MRFLFAALVVASPFTVHGLIGATGSSRWALTSEASAEDARQLLADLTRAARVPGSVVEAEAAELCARALRAAGLEVEVRTVGRTVRLPVRQELAGFADAAATTPLRERYETFDWDALPQPPVPPCCRGSAAADVRAPLVDGGTGSDDELARLAGAGVSVRGSIVLVRSRAPMPELARTAEAQGAAGLLVFRPQHSDRPSWPAGPWAGPRDVAGDAVHAGCTIPVVTVDAAETEALTSGLRRRRVRGANGEVTTLAAGPGPVEVRLRLEVPAREVRAHVVTARTVGAQPDAPTLRVELGSYGRAGVAAAELAVALRLAELRAHRGPFVIELGPPADVTADGPVPMSAEPSPRATGAADAQDLAEQLAAIVVPSSSDAPRTTGLGRLLDLRTDLVGTQADGFTLVDRHLDPGGVRVENVARFLAAASERLAGKVPGDAEAGALRDLATRHMPWHRH